MYTPSWKRQPSRSRGWGANPNILWIKMGVEGLDYFVASIYMPDSSRNKEEDEVAAKIFVDIDTMPDRAIIILLGEWDFDPLRTRAATRQLSGRCLHTPD